MEYKDLLKGWLKNSLEEETKDIYFSAEAREKVRLTIIKEAAHPANKKKGSELSTGWWNRPVSLSMKAVSFCIITLFFVTVFYTKTFFYVSDREIAKFEMREKIIIHDSGVPFGAVQHFVVALEKGKGVAHP